MTTLISDELRWAAYQIIHGCGYSSAVLSGLAPDPRHLDNGGFHCSVEDLLAHGNGGDYSNTRASDKGFNPKYGAAFDISMAQSDMIRAWGRVHAAWADKTDPRRKYVNAINGWSGSGDATRLDFDAGTAKKASDDHKWHNHGEIHRRYVRDPKAARAVVSIYKGEPKAAWIAREETNKLEDDMPLNEADKKWIAAEVRAAVKAEAGKAVWIYDIDPSANTYSAGGGAWVDLQRAGSLANEQVPALTVAVAQLAQKQIDPAILVGALVPALTDAIVARLPEDRDDVTADELKTAVVAAARELIGLPVAAA